MRAEAISQHTFTTEGGIKIVIKFKGSHFDGAALQFPGSGNRPIHIVPDEIAELAEAAREAMEFLKEEELLIAQRTDSPDEFLEIDTPEMIG